MIFVLDNQGLKNQSIRAVPLLVGLGQKIPKPTARVFEVALLGGIVDIY
jgi:hypothetical protein